MNRRSGPRVSVVVPVRDGADHVASAVNSALQQTAGDLEVVVVENGSQDETVQVVESLAAEDRRVRLLRMAPRGVSAARNLAIHAARGTWLAFLDADDVWRADKLELQLRTSDGELRFSDCWLINGQGRRLCRFHELSPPPSALHGAAPVLLRHLVGASNCVPLSTVVVRRDRLLAAGGFSEGLSHAEDWHLWLRLLLAGCSWSRSPEPLTDYVVAAGRASRDLLAMVDGERAALNVLRPQLREAGLDRVAASRDRALRRSRIVYNRRSEAGVRERAADLARIFSLGASPRSLAAQAVYTVAPNRMISRISGTRHDLMTRLEADNQLQE